MDTSEVADTSSTNIKFDDIWVDGILWCFKWNFETVGIGQYSHNDWKTSKDFGTFNLEVKKISPTEFEVAVNRKREEISMPSDDGCYLKCNITVVGGDNPRTVPMRFGDYRVGSIFQYNEIDNSAKDAGIFTVLCVIKMSETGVLNNEECREQNNFIEDLKTNDNAEIMEDMAFLLNRKSLDTIFTGRQTTDFAKLKTAMIERTLPFAHEIAKKVRNKQRNIRYEPQTSPEVYLGYIYDKDVERINKEQLFSLYLNAHFCGLQYLVSECIDFMVFKTEPEDLMHILTLSELTLDSELSSKATTTFLENIEKIRKTSTWNYFIKEEPITRCFLDSVRRNFNAEGNLILKLGADIRSSILDAKRKRVEENSKALQSSPLMPQVGEEDAKQHPDEKQNTDKESKMQQNSEESGGTQVVHMEEAEASSNMERCLDEPASSNEGDLILKVGPCIRNAEIEAKRKLEQENSKEVQSSPLLPHVDEECAKQHLDEKRNTDKESQVQQNFTEESDRATQDVDKKEAASSSNIEPYLDEPGSLSEGEKMQCSSAHEQPMESSNPEQYNRGVVPVSAEDDADMERNFLVRLPTTAEVSNPEQHSFDEPHNVSEGVEKFELSSTNNQPAVHEEVSDMGYSKDESNVKAVNEEPMEETSDDKKDEVESCKDQNSTEGSDSAEGERLEGNSDEQKRPVKHSMEE